MRTVVDTPALTIRTIETKADQDQVLFEMTGWTRAEMEQCCYDPSADVVRNRPGEPHCTNIATLDMGSAGEFWLCEACAALPRFKRFKIREPRPRS